MSVAEDAARGLVAWDGGARAAAVAVRITSTAGAAQGVSSVRTIAAAAWGDADACAEPRGGARESAEMPVAEDAVWGLVAWDVSAVTGRRYLLDRHFDHRWLYN